MTQEDDLVRLKDYVSVQDAAEMLNLSPITVYEYARDGRLDSIRIGGGVAVSLESIRNLKFNTPGRLRQKPPDWRKYSPRNNVFATGIEVRIYPGQHQNFLKKIQLIQKEEKHTFKGSIARYILIDENDSDLVRIWLIWKDTEMPDSGEHEREMGEFEKDLADVLDWSTSRHVRSEGLIYT